MYSYIFYFDIIISLTTPIIDYYLTYITPSYLPILKKKERMIIKIPTRSGYPFFRSNSASATDLSETMFKSILSFDKPINSLPVTNLQENLPFGSHTHKQRFSMKNVSFYIPYRTQKYTIWLNNRDCPK